jgi:hypothetical protein
LEYLNELRVQSRKDQDIGDSPSPSNFTSGNAEKFMEKVAEVIKKRRME